MTKPSLFRSVFLAMAILLAAPLHAGGTKLPEVAGVTWLAGSAVEGGMILGRAEPGTGLELDDAALRMATDGHFIIGFHRDSDDPVRLAVTTPSGNERTVTFSAGQRTYDIQRIDGLKRDHVTPPQAVLDRIGADSAAVRAARSREEAGSQRILNGEPRQPHYGIDIAAPRGTPVTAPAGGRVTLVRDLYFSGWTILLTHGLGLNSAFLHLDSVTVAEGDEVARGAMIGTVGSTGRSTGPHLDWRLDWQGRRLDAALVRTQLADGS